jgi:hypothetical protein
VPLLPPQTRQFDLGGVAGAEVVEGVCGGQAAGRRGDELFLTFEEVVLLLTDAQADGVDGHLLGRHTRLPRLYGEAET